MLWGPSAAGVAGLGCRWRFGWLCTLEIRSTGQGGVTLALLEVTPSESEIYAAL